MPPSTTTATALPTSEREATRTSYGARIGRTSQEITAPAWLVSDARCPKPIRDGFERMARADAQGRVLWRAVTDAAKQITELEVAKRRAHRLGEDGPPREELDEASDAKAKAEGALAQHIDAAYKDACATEVVMRERHGELQALAATIAVEAYTRATAAWAEWEAAIDLRDAAYGRLGRPQDPSALNTGEGLDYRRSIGLGNRISLARADLRTMTEGFPRDLVAAAGEGASK